MLKTRWTDSVDLSQPLNDYPRPQFVRDSYFSLNGKWQYKITKSPAIPDDYDGEIVVPFSPESELSGVNKTVGPNDYLIYKKSFVLPSDFNKGRVYINFGAVDQIATVYINGKCVGTHKGGYTPFRFELSEYINESENDLVVLVKDFSDTKFYSRGKQKINRGGIWYTAQSGIWQSVWLESTPIEHLDSVRITPDYDNELVRFEFFGTDDVETLIYDGNELIADTTEHTVKIPDFKPWSPENPFLYKVVFKACDEKIKSYFGMRKFSVGTDGMGIKRLLLNYKPYFHNCSTKAIIPIQC